MVMMRTHNYMILSVTFDKKEARIRRETPCSRSFITRLKILEFGGIRSVAVPV
jgi:hypothetical protein